MSIQPQKTNQRRPVEIEQSDGSLFDDLPGAQHFRSQTIKFVQQSLGLGPQVPQITPASPIISSFRAIGERLSVAYTIGKNYTCTTLGDAEESTVDQRKLFLDEMSFFMEMSEAEQQSRLDARIPTVDEFWKFRMGATAVGVCLAVLEYV